MILDLSTGGFEHYTVLDENDSVFSLPFKGLFNVVDGHLIILYKKTDMDLSLVVGELVFAMKEDFSTGYHVEGAEGFLKIKDEHTSITVKFLVEDHKPVSSKFCTEDEEDANFGLWLYNVLNADERKRSYWTHGSC